VGQPDAQRSGVGVLDKAVAVLEASVEGASLAELVERSGLPRATAHRLAQALEVHGLLTRDENGRWRPGPKLSELASATPDPLLAAAPAVLAALRDATGESTQLYLRRGDERVCVAASERMSGLRDTVPVGAVLTMLAGSAVAKAKFTARTLTEVRRRGWAQSVAEREAGVASVSAPIRDRTGRIVAAVSLSGPIERLGRRPGEKHARLVMAAGHRLSAVVERAQRDLATPARSPRPLRYPVAR
jgi:DNA-binding IclR family transcriptional regulator